MNKRIAYIALLAFSTISLLNSTLAAQSNTQPAFYNEIAKGSFLGGIRSSLDSNGIDFEFSYKGEVFSNISGGTETKTVYLDNFDLIFDINLTRLLGLHGTNLHTYILGNHGKTPKDYAGAIQGISNIAAFNTWKLYEMWIEQNLFDDNLSLLAGLYDLNSEFDSQETSAIFINPSHGIGPDFSLTGKNGPSIFPTTSLAFRVRYNYSPNLKIRVAAFDGVPGDINNPAGTHISFNKDDGLLITSEINYVSESEEYNSDFLKYALGFWYYTSEFENILNTGASGNLITQKGNLGFYASAEKFLYSEKLSTEEGLAAFIRAGMADNNINQVDAYIGGGINYIGLLPGREEDVFGFAIAAAHNNSKYISLMKENNIDVKNFEIIFELTYNLTIFDWLNLQPDIQYVLNPVISYNSNHAFLLGTRLMLSIN